MRILHIYIPFILMFLNASFGRPGDDRLATQKALQTVVAGRQAENLLCAFLFPPILLVLMIDLSSPLSDFDDDDDTAASDGQPSGLAATQVLSQTPAAANLLAGTSSNPLDDLVSIFGGSGGGFGSTPAPASVGGAPSAAATASSLDPLAGLGLPSGGGISPATPGQPQQQGQQEDLLGLF